MERISSWHLGFVVGMHACYIGEQRALESLYSWWYRCMHLILSASFISSPPCIESKLDRLTGSRFSKSHTVQDPSTRHYLGPDPDSSGPS